MPRIDPKDHLSRQWRVHALAADFALLDVWDYPITTGPEHDLAYFEAFARQLERAISEGPGLAGILFRVRTAVGRLFGWDETSQPLPILGCKETSLRQRLEPSERSDAPVDPAADKSGPSPAEGIVFTTVYHHHDELLEEISNSTVHALAHVSWIDRGCGRFGPRMAVYVKPRGWAGRLYMSIINPFRVFVVYPAMMRHLQRQWERAHGDGTGATNASSQISTG